jgi:hypothetical protein
MPALALFLGVLIFGAYPQPRSGTGLVAHPVFKTGRPS